MTEELHLWADIAAVMMIVGVATGSFAEPGN